MAWEIFDPHDLTQHGDAWDVEKPPPEQPKQPQIRLTGRRWGRTLGVLPKSQLPEFINDIRRLREERK